MRGFKLSLIALCLFCGIAVGARQAPDPATPEGTIRSFLTAITAGDLDKAVVFIENAKYDAAFDSISRIMKTRKDAYSIADVKTEVAGDQATTKISGTITSDKAAPLKFTSIVKLHKKDGNWRIVPDKAAAKSDSADFVNAIAFTLTDPETIAKLGEAQRAIACMTNLKNLGLGVLMFLQDNDENYAFKVDDYKKVILKYLKGDQFFHCPLDDAAVTSYSFNPHLSGVSLGLVRDPSKTVMLYEGKAGKLNYRHLGKAAVAFIDGHVKMVTEEDSKQLRWMP